MGVFRSQTPRAIFVLHNLITAKLAISFMGVSALFICPYPGCFFYN